MYSLTAKLSFVLASFFISMALPGKAQPCRQIVISDTTQRKLLSNYISESIRKGTFVDDKGVVVVTRFEHESKRQAWLVTSVIDNRYKENPPVEWANLDSDIILFYDTVSSRYDVVKRVVTPEIIQCLDEVIGDRVYIRPPRRDRWIKVHTPDNRTIRVKSRRIFGGNTHNDKIWIFEVDGSITTLIPV